MQQRTNRYYPANLTQDQRQRYLQQILENTPNNQINPVVFGYAIGMCDFNNLNLYLDYGLNLHCYTQENSINIITFFSKCRVQGEEERNKVLERLLNAGLDPNDGTTKSNQGSVAHYPIAAAVEDCDVSMLDILLKNKANPNLKTTGEQRFPVFNICYKERDYAKPQKESPSGMDTYPETPVLPMANIMLNILKYGGDPNTIFVTNDKRHLATKGKTKVLKLACSGQDKQAKSLYDFYASEFQQVKADGDPTQIDNYEKLLRVLRKYKAKPLSELCQGVK